jgi:hypothetical protein
MNASDYKTLLTDNTRLGYKHPSIVAQMNAMSNSEIDTFIVYEGFGEDVVREIIDLWSNDYETLLDNGYYPFADKNDPGNIIQTHVFEKNNLIWRQLTGATIKGLDDNHSERLLQLLNGDVHHCTQIRNTRGVVLFTKLESSSFSCI